MSVNDVDRMDSDLDDAERFWIGLKFGFGVAFLLAIGGWCATVSASEYVRDGGTADWQCCADKGCATVISQHADSVRAEKACGKLADADGQTRYIRSHAFRITPTKVQQPEPCPAKPADERRPGVCPAGSSGVWEQLRTYSSAPAPQCWVAGEWSPATPPDGKCIVDLTAPTVTATRVDSATAGKHNVTLTWAAIAGATSYEVERCTGAACTNFTQIGVVSVLAYANNGLPSGFTLRYRVRAVDAARQGPYSNIAEVLTPAAPPVAGVVTLNWEPTPTSDDPKKNPVGYWIYHYKVSDNGRRGAYVVDIKDPKATSYTYTGLTPDFYSFFMFAYNAAGEHGSQSNYLTREVK